jgi:hypothetical protein
MNEAPISEVMARRFLLGQCGDLDRERIESLFVTDAVVKETILLAEQELIDEYLDGSLVGQEREQFVRQYQTTAQLRHRIKIAESLRKRGLTQPPVRHRSSVLERFRGMFSSPWSGHRRLLIPATAALILLMIITAFWLVRWNNERVRERNQQIELANELAELNSPTNMQKTPPQMSSLLLSPVNLRTANAPSQSAPASDDHVIELRLLWMFPDKNEGIEATIRRIGAAENLTISNLKAETISGIRIVKLRLPGYLVTRGEYQVTLRTSPENRTSGPDAEYVFRAD